MTEKSSFNSIDDYISSVPHEVQGALKKIRGLIKQVAPAAVETISYQMPAFKEEKVFIYFAAFKKHIGIYPPVSGSKELEESLAPYRGPKGNLKFPLNEPMPLELIKRVVEALHKKYGS